MVSRSRRERIEAMLAADPNDVFLLYGLAMELLREGEGEQAVGRLREVTERFPDYHAAHFQLGQYFVQAGQAEVAGHWLALGIDAARRTGDSHAAQEMTQLLESL